MLELRPLVEAMGARCQGCDGEFASMAASVRDSRAAYGGGDSGRHWFLRGYPNCDAMLIAAHVMHILSRTKQAFSELAAS
jgi:hypothetical protein